LKKPVTFGSPSTLTGQRIYLLADGYHALGFLKVGTKRLFVAPPQLNRSSDSRDALVEINPTCVLDFYVHESCQRSGCGKRIFDEMVHCEGVHPKDFAYDRPSPKLIGFLRKHFGLCSYVPQNNNYVVFDEFFQSSHQGRKGSRSSSSRRGAGAPQDNRGKGVATMPRGILPLGEINRTAAAADAYSAFDSMGRPPLMPPSAAAALPSYATQPEMVPGLAGSLLMPSASTPQSSFLAPQQPSSLLAPWAVATPQLGNLPQVGISAPSSRASSDHFAAGARHDKPGLSSKLQAPWGTSVEAPELQEHRIRRRLQACLQEASWQATPEEVARDRYPQAVQAAASEAAARSLREFTVGAVGGMQARFHMRDTE